MGSQPEVMNWSTRNFRKDLHFRLKLLSVHHGVTLEEMVNKALEIGVMQLEAEQARMAGKII